MLVTLKIMFPDYGTQDGEIVFNEFADENWANGAAPTVSVAPGQTFTQVAFDAGVGNTFLPDFIAFIKVDMVVTNDAEAGGGTVDLRLYTNNAIAIPGLSVDTRNVGLTDLLGPQGRDYAFEPSGLVAARYAIPSIVTNPEVVDVPLSKLYCGNLFDPGRKPLVRPVMQGLERSPNPRRIGRQFRITWRGLSTAKRSDFTERVWRHGSEAPIVLWDPDDCVFNGFKMLHCQLIRADFRSMDVHNQHELNILVEEIL
jgi:hypothetical protein